MYISLMISFKELRLLPNMLTLSRIVFLPLLYALFFLERLAAFLTLYVVIGMTDMLDGFLARRLSMVTKTGQFLDSFADIFFNFSTAFFLMYRVPRITQEHIALISVMVVLGIAYLIIALVKFGHVHFIHTNLFRIAGVGIYACFVFSFFFEPIILTRIVIILLILSTIESILIYLIFGEVDADVRYITHLRREGRIESKKGSGTAGEDG